MLFVIDLRTRARTNPSPMITPITAVVASLIGGLAGCMLFFLLFVCILKRSIWLGYMISSSKLCIRTFISLGERLRSWAGQSVSCIQKFLFPESDKNFPNQQIFSSLVKCPADLKFLDEEQAFGSLQIIGRGGCGVVYKAEWPSSRGKFLAIKKIQHVHYVGESDVNQVEDTKSLNWRMRQIRSEIKTAGHIRHRNLLPLLAHVARPNCHFLVYEFKNSSLQHLLQKVQAGALVLTWPARSKIIGGIAAGLEYLHMHHSTPIIHRDLKPANILLSDDMEALITDFGLAKALKEYGTTSRVVGTLGYIAPEYYQTLKFTEKSDIYSFGVVLAAMATGMLPSDKFFQKTDELCPVKWLRNVVSSENPYRAIDRKLFGRGYEDQILLALRIACFCTMDDPLKRPNSKEVLFMLSQIES